ncbi:MAG: DUF4082 domain-containing protein [Burkholderiaceae bacterium]|nr:DUF4082 domain-containing protein [Burkholderiaceae bacterium]
MRTTLIAASCATLVACGGGSENDGLSNEDALAAIGTTSEKASSTCPCTIWPTTTLPRIPAADDTASVNVGVKFTTDVSGYVTGIRFYKGTGNSGTHVGSLWSKSGRLLARATFTNETATGWQTVTFSTPVAISAGRSYTASYLAPKGRYAIDQGYFSQAFTASPLRATAGVYKYGSKSSFPNSQWNSSNYWVDVVFATTTASTTAPVPETTAALSWVASSTPSVVGYRIYYGTSSGNYVQARGAGINAGNSSSFTVKDLSPGNTYFFSVTAVDDKGNESSYSTEASKALQ